MVLKVAETQSLQHALQLQLQEKEKRISETESLSQQKEAQLEQQVFHQEILQHIPHFSQILGQRTNCGLIFRWLRLALI